MLSQLRKYRFITPVILAIFSLSAIGVHLDVHFCKGKISGIKLISFSQNTESKSCCPQTCSTDFEKDKNCCNDEEVNASMDYDGMPIVLELENSSQVDIHLIASLFVLEPPFIKSIIAPSDTGPPLSSFQIRILYQSFLC